MRNFTRVWTNASVSLHCRERGSGKSGHQLLLPQAIPLHNWLSHQDGWKQVLETLNLWKAQRVPELEEPLGDRGKTFPNREPRAGWALGSLTGFPGQGHLGAKGERTFLGLLQGFLGNRDDGRRKRRWRERRVISAINYISTTAYIPAPGLKKHSFGTTIKVLNSMLHKSGRWNEKSFPVGTRRQERRIFYPGCCSPAGKGRACEPGWKTVHLLLLLAVFFIF